MIKIFSVLKTLFEWKMIGKCKSMKTVKYLQVLERVELEYLQVFQKHESAHIFLIEDPAFGGLRSVCFSALGSSPVAQIFGVALTKTSGEVLANQQA